jgi:two-component system, NtrC family, response regulator PilR
MILVVDDEYFALEFLRRKLEGFGFRIETAHTIKDAIAVMQKNESIRIVISDLHLVEGSGIEVLKWTHENRPDIKKIIISAHTYESEMLDAKNERLYDYALSKPVDIINDLVPMLRNFLGDDARSED